MTKYFNFRKFRAFEWQKLWLILSLLIIGISLSITLGSPLQASPLKQNDTNCESLSPLICSGVEFHKGEISFADRVISYQPAADVASSHDDPASALGIPDYVADNLGTGYVALGNAGNTCEGELIVEFLDNVLVDVPGDDLYIFEVGPMVEATEVFISVDSQNWISLGQVEGATRGVDIADKVTPDQKFHFVRLCDFPDGNTSGSPFGGPDIDAVGAIGTEALEDEIKVNWDIPFCQGANTVTVPVEICNNSGTAHTYDVTFASLPANGDSCDVDGPTNFTTLDPTPVTVNAQDCSPVNVQIGRPAGMDANGQVACYRATARNLETGDSVTTRGSVQDSRQWCVTPPSNLTIDLPLGSTETLSFMVTNTDDSGEMLTYEIEAMTSAMTDNDALLINGQPVGSTVSGTISLPLDASTVISVDVALPADSDQPLPSFYDVIMLANLDEDSNLEPLASASVRPIIVVYLPMILKN